MHHYLKPAVLLDYQTETIQEFLRQKEWNKLAPEGKTGAAYHYVRDDVAFGYNVDDAMPASRVLQDGYGQCHTKGTLFMALLRALGIPCGLHGFSINKALQKGAMKGFYCRQPPKEIVHSWVEVFFEERWGNWEGFILDDGHLAQLQEIISDCCGSFCGYGVALTDFKNPPVDWNGSDAYIQKEGIVQDFGVFDTPAVFFAAHQQKLRPFKKFAYR